jgi:hypothetical protein
MKVYPRGSWENTTSCLALTCWSAKCLPGRFGASVWWSAASLLSQCNVAWRSFPRTGGSGCRSFDSPCCFISAKCGSSVSTRFWSHRAHSVCFCALVTILTCPLQFFFIVCKCLLPLYPGSCSIFQQCM